MRIRHLSLYLPGDLYKELERVAQAEERDPTQQARWIIRRALRENKQGESCRHEIGETPIDK